MATSFVDLSHIITHGLVTYEGLPSPLICDFLSRKASESLYAPGTSFHIGKIEMIANTGTYIDAPFHRFEEGGDIAQLPLEAIASVPALCVTVSADQRAIEASAFDARAFDASDVSGKAVLIHTGWSRHWTTPQYSVEHPFLSAGAAKWLRDAGARLVGIDSCNMDDTTDGRRPAHTILLGANIPIVEHLCNLSALPPSGFTFSAVPAKVEGMGTFPVRAFATV